MRGKVKRVMDFIHSIAYMELQGSEYVEFLESIGYALDQELEEGSWQDSEEDE